MTKETTNTLNLNGHTLTGSEPDVVLIVVDGCELTITGTGSIKFADLILMAANEEGAKIVVGGDVTLNGILRNLDGGILDLTGATIPEAGLTVKLQSVSETNVSDVLLLPADYYFFVGGVAVSSFSETTTGTVLKHTEHSYTYTDNGDGTHKATCTACGKVEVDNEPHTIGNHVCTACGAMEIVVSFNAGDFEWKTGDKLYFCRVSGDNEWEEYAFTATVAGDGTVTWTPDRTLYWDGTGEHKLVVIYPDTGYVWDTWYIDEDQSTLENLRKNDHLNSIWSGNPTTDPITFDLKHRLAKVTVNYEAAEGVTVSKAEVYTLTQYLLFDIHTLERKNVAWEEGHDLWINSYHNGNQFTAFVSPDAYAADGNFIKITLSDGSVREVKMNKAVTFEEGAEYTYTVVITADGAYLTCADECTFEYTDNEDGLTHSKTCSKCGYVAASEAHSGGTATCTEQAKCQHCGASYGELAAHTPDANGKCTAENCGYQYAAKVGDTFYETIHKALREAEGINGCTLTLLDDVTLTSMSSYASYVNTGMFTLDLNGKTLSSNKRTLEVMGSADLTIRDSIGGGKIVSTGGSAVYLSGDKLTIESGIFEGSLDGVFLSGSSTLTVKGGTFTGSRAMITGFGSNVEIDLTAIDPSGLTLKNNGSGTFAPKLPEGYGMVGSDGKLLSSLSAEQSATVHKHEYKYTDLGDGNHQQACSCGLTTGEPAAHSITAEDDRPATCVAKAYCSVCDSEYGEVDITNHVSENYTYTDNGDGTHTKVHECGVTVGEPEGHTIENHVCTACGAMEIVVSSVTVWRWAKANLHVPCTLEVTENVPTLTGKKFTDSMNGRVTGNGELVGTSDDPVHIGVTVTNESSTNTGFLADNAKWSNDGSGWNSNTVTFYADNANSQGISAYYPYAESGSVAYDLTSGGYLLYRSNQRVTSQYHTVDMMDQMLARLVVMPTLSEALVSSGDEIKAIEVSGIYTEATFNGEDGTLTTTGNPNSAICLAKNDDGTWETLLIPMDGTTVTLTIQTVNGRYFTTTTPTYGDDSFYAGMQWNVAVNVGHAGEPNYADNGDGTHSAVYPCCGTTVTEDHSTTAEDDKEATCEAKAYCSVCDSEYGEKNPDNHTNEEFTYTDNEDGLSHMKVHKCCGATYDAAEGHTGGEATCTTQALCEACGASYGETLGHDSVVDANDETDTITISCRRCSFRNVIRLIAPENPVYNGQPHHATVEGEAFSRLTYSGSTINAGECTATLQLSNYKASVSVTYTIAKADPQVTAPAPNDLTYTGEALYLISAGEATGGQMHYSTDNQTWSTTIPQGTDAGKYTVYYKVVGDANHSDTAVDSVEVTIAKADPTYSVPAGLTAIYGDTLAVMTLPNGWAWKDADTTAVGNAGKHTFTAIFTPADTANYKTVEADVEIEVTCDHTHNTSKPTDDGNGKHSFACSICGITVTEDHIMDPATGLCDSGCGKMMAEASVTKSVAGGIAGIGSTTYYETLNEAIQAVSTCTAGDNATVRLEQSIDMGDSTQWITSGVFIFDLNGKELKTSDIGLSISSADVTIADSSASGTGKITGGTYGVHAGNGSTVELLGGTVSGNYYGVMAESATAKISGGTVTGAYSVFAHGGTVEVSRGTVSGENHGVYAVASGTVKVTGGTVSGNNGVFAFEGSTVEILGGTVSGDTGVYAYNSTVEISGGTVSGDYGVYAYDNSTVTISGATISGTITDIYSDNSSVKLTLGTEGVGATFPGGITVEYTTLAEILADGLAYWQGDRMIVLTDGQTKITGGDVTVKAACDHMGSQHTTATPNTDGTTHNFACSICGITVTEDHIMDPATGLCNSGCGKMVAEASVTKSVAGGIVGIGSTTYYETLNEAIQAVSTCTAGDKAEVKLLSSLTLTETIAISSGVFTLDLNGKDVTFSKDTAFGFDISGGDVTFAGTGTVTMENGTAIFAKKDAVVTISGGTYDGAVAVLSYGTATITGGTLKGSVYGIRNLGDLTIAGGEVSSYQKNTTNPYDIAAILSLEGRITVTGGTLNEGRFGTVEYVDGTIDLSGFGGAEDVTIWCSDVTATAMEDTDVKLPEGFGLFDEKGTQQTGSIAKGTMLTVKQLHVHDWSYMAEGDTITATCNGTIGECPEAEQTITICADDKTYDGTPVTATLEGSIEGVDTPTITYSGNTNVGTYRASIKLGGATASVEFTIERATPAVKWANTSASVDYTGAAASITAPTVTLVNGETFGGTISYSYTGTASGSGLPVNAGTYEITASIAAQGNYSAASSTNKLTLTIEKQKITISGMAWDVPENAVYSGTAYTATLTGDLPEGVTVIKTGDTATNAGGYTAKAVFSLAEGYSADNYEIVNGEDLTAEWSIDKAALTITADSYESVRYGSAAPAFAANYSGFVNGETEAVLGGELVFSCEYDTADAAKRKPGNYPIVPGGLTSNNYEISYVDGNLEVISANLVIVIDDKTVTYGDAAPEYTYHYEGFVYGEDISVMDKPGTVVCGYKPGDPVGTMEILSDNYGEDDCYHVVNQRRATLTIEKLAVAEPTVSRTYTYNGSEQAVTLTGMERYMTIASGNEAVGAGSYEVVITLDGNHKWADGSDGKVQWSIAKAEPKAEDFVFQAPSNLTYNGETKSASVSVKTGIEGMGKIIAVMYYNADSSPAVEKQPISAGNYFVQINVDAGENYTEKSFFRGEDWVFSIGKAKAEITVNTTPITVTYGETVTLPTATANFGTVTCDKTAADLENAGTYTVTYTVADTANYDGDTKSITVTVKPKTITEADVELNGSLTYTGEEQTQPITVAAGITYTVTGDKATNVGTYQLTVKGTGNYTGEVKLSWSIKEAAAVVTKAPAAKTLTYTGETQELITAGEAEGGTMQYQLNGGAWSASIPTAIDEGSYTVSYKVIGDANHSDTEVKSLTVTIGDCTHSGNTNKDDADCTTQVTCSVCGDVLVAAKAHVWGDWTTTKNPTTTEEGSKERPCTNEGCKEKDSESIPMLNEVEAPKPEGGDISVDKPTPATGEDVTITVTPDTGKEIVDVVVKDEGGNEIPVTKNEDGSYTYEQPDGNVTIEVEIKDSEYEIDIQQPEGGKVETDEQNPNMGDKVTVTVTPEPGKEVDDITVTDNDGNEIPVTDNGDGTYSYEQPAGDVNIDVTMKDSKYEVDIRQPDGGEVKTDNDSPIMGDDVTITVTPDTGKEVDEVIVTGKDGKEIPVTDNGDGTYTYEQPDGDVAVEVVIKDTIYTVTWTVDGKTYKETEHKYGQTITAPTDPTKAQSGCTTYTFDKWNGFTSGMTMPDNESLTFTAVFTEGESHIDENTDHICDRNCGKTDMGDHVDGNLDHVCDYGCDVAIGEHKDTDKDHACDYGCTDSIGTCEDADKDHDCDYGCDKSYGVHEDADKDHACDYGCSESIGTCEDADKDHDCDYGCDKAYGTHEDTDKDHACDYGCKEVIGTCEDADKDHDCDYGCDKTYGTHEDTDKDHACDYGCSESIGTCEDADKDHDCDYGCDKAYGTHEDADKDHVCDYGCTESIGTCEDADKDHDCDYGCDKVYGEHTDSDSDQDHKCDYCGEAMPKDGIQVILPDDATGTIKPGYPAEIDGKPIVIDWDGELWLPTGGSRLLVTYTFNEDADPHKAYPTAMYAWYLNWTDEDGDGTEDRCEAIRIPELDNFMTYKGTSIRVNHSSDGIRFFTAVPVDALNKLMEGTLLTGELEGYKLVEMGTLYKWAATGTELTVVNGAKSYVYGGNAGSNFRVFSKEGDTNWFTGMLTNLPGDAETLAKDIISRPYAILENADGQQITLYGGSVQRSIYYVALQNKDTWASGTAYDNYVEKIISTVEAAKG